MDVTEQKLTRQDKEIIIDKSQGIINTRFHFHNTRNINWEGIDKFAIFTNVYNDRNYVHLGRGNDCTCTVPSEAMVGRVMNVTVYGGEHITTNNVSFILTPSNYKHYPPKPPHHNGGCGGDIFSDIYNQIGTKIDDIDIIEKKLLLYRDEEIIKIVDLEDALLSDYYTRLYLDNVLSTKYDDFSICDGFIICSSEGVELKRIPLSAIDDYYYSKSDIDGFLTQVHDRIDSCFVNADCINTSDGVYLILEDSRQE